MDNKGQLSIPRRSFIITASHITRQYDCFWSLHIVDKPQDH